MKTTTLAKRTLSLVISGMLIGGSTLTLSPAAVSAQEQFQLEEITVSELTAGYASGKYTTKQIVQAYLDRIEKYEGTYNAFTFMNENALKEAEEIDRLRSEGAELGPLAGVPVVIKEAVDVAGFPSTFGWAPLSKEAGGIELMPVEDAPVVTRLKEAGAIIIGKTNIPAFSATGTHASTSWAGPTYNAMNPSFAPGGSSSGTAAAISGNFAVLGIAEETGGSIQNPAAAQGIVGIKPSFGLIPTTGVTPLAGSTRDVLGPHARTVEDAAIMLDVMAGYSEKDEKTKAAIGHVPEEGYAAAVSDTALEGKRIGLYGPGWRDAELTSETKELYEQAIKELEGEGAIVVEDPFAGSGFKEYVKTAGNVGMESFFYDLESYLKNLNPADESLSVESVFEAAGQIPWTKSGPLNYMEGRFEDLDAAIASAGEEPDLTNFFKVRDEYLRIIDSVMEEQDLDGFVYPQMSIETPKLGEGDIGATTVSEINVSGLPLITVPAGYYESGAPFGLAFFGEMWGEADIIAMAYDYQQATEHRVAPELIEKAADYTDVTPNSPYYPAVMSLAANGAVDSDAGQFLPNENITRSETADIIAKGLHLTVPQNVSEALQGFEDISADDEYAGSIASTVTEGIFEGGSSLFMDDEPLTREQMASVLVRAFELTKAAGSEEIINTANISPAHKEDVIILAQHGITVELDQFRPKAAVTRGEFAAFMYRAMELTGNK
ncbi:amidase family protein [Neobacillus mesonae]|nr:amidase family protein [Neobacillus mesonae]